MLSCLIALAGPLEQKKAKIDSDETTRIDEATRQVS